MRAWNKWACRGLGELELEAAWLLLWVLLVLEEIFQILQTREACDDLVEKPPDRFDPLIGCCAKKSVWLDMMGVPIIVDRIEELPAC